MLLLDRINIEFVKCIMFRNLVIIKFKTTDWKKGKLTSLNIFSPKYLTTNNKLLESFVTIVSVFGNCEIADNSADLRNHAANLQTR